MTRRSQDRPQPAWSRRSLRVLVVAATAVAITLAAGLGLGVWYLVNDTDTTPSGNTMQAEGRGTDSGSPADRLANRAFPAVDPQAAHPGPLTTRQVDELALPAATDVGPGGVPTGFPHTPEGALAQLAAIDQTAIESGSIAGAQEVISHWSTPGGPTAETWSAVAAVTTLLDAAGLPASGSATMTVQLEPAMGFIKGHVGQDFVVPCIDFVLVVTVQTTHRAATADCQRMTWRPGSPTGRWVIGPGAEPAPAPSVWPGTETSVAAGYLMLTVTP